MLATLIVMKVFGQGIQIKIIPRDTELDEQDQALSGEALDIIKNGHWLKDADAGDRFIAEIVDGAAADYQIKGLIRPDVSEKNLVSIPIE